MREVKERLPRFAEFINFVAVSGLRFNEAVNSYNLIISLSAKRELDKYYDVENQVLEHYNFRKLFIRRTKKAFISYIPENLVIKISKKQNLSTFQIYNAIRTETLLKSRFGDIREYYATFMTNYLNSAEIDFLQGPVSAGVFTRNYFNPAMIQDLEERAFLGIKAILTEID